MKKSYDNFPLPLAFSLESPKSVTQAETRTKPSTQRFSAYLSKRNKIQNCRVQSGEKKDSLDFVL